MAGVSAARELVLFIALAMIALWPITAGLLRYRVRRVFGTDPPDLALLEPVWRKLDQINAECQHTVFGAARVTSVMLAGHTVVLIYGLVGSSRSLQGETWQRVYTIAQGDEIEWMRRFPDVFDLAVSTLAGTVFWVKLSALIRLTSRGSS